MGLPCISATFPSNAPSPGSSEIAPAAPSSSFFGPDSIGAWALCWALLRLRDKINTPSAPSNNATTPPTVPPTMAPMLLLLGLVEDVDEGVGVAEVLILDEVFTA